MSDRKRGGIPEPRARTESMRGDAAGDGAELFRQIVDSLEEVAIFALSPAGVIRSWNRGAQRLFGYAVDEAVGQPLAILYTDGDAATGVPEFELESVRAGRQVMFDRAQVGKDRSRFWVHKTVSILRDADGACAGFGMLLLLTGSSKSQVSISGSRERELQAVSESVDDYAIFATSADGKITSWNPGAQTIFGYSSAEIVGRDQTFLMPAAEAEAASAAREPARSQVRGQRWLMRKDGSVFLARRIVHWIDADDALAAGGYLNVIREIGEREVDRELVRSAHFDELTGLPNRRAFYTHLQRAISQIRRRPELLFAVLFIDLDHFKRVNDQFGHILADKVLTECARRLEICIRAEDVVARIGGDEFAIILNGIAGIADPTDAAERIAMEMRKPMVIEGHDTSPTVSIGIALGSEGYERPEDILRDADTAMYVAKVEGRARTVVFEPSMAATEPANIDLAGDVRRAIENGEFYVTYQPVIRLSDLAVIGFEALIRWQHPALGLLQPSSFVPKAEESDLIITIDRWMIAQAAAQSALLHGMLADGGTPKISINVSSRNFSHPGFFDELIGIINAHGADPAALRLEITESALLEQSERVNALVAAIRAVGIEVDVDDFGTGYSSLSALNYMFVDALKIDVSFVRRIRSANGAELVRTIITLAHNLGIVAIAEGIETGEHLHRLKALGCDYGQGFYFSPSLDGDAAVRLLREGLRISV